MFATSMKFRFSLRALFILTAVFAGFCYYWIVMPGAMAKRFVNAINREDYQSADDLIRSTNDRVLTQWQDKYWGFRSDAAFLPWSFAQFLCGRREVQLHVTYFFLDEHHDIETQLAATSFGMQSPGQSISNNAMMIDRDEPTTLKR
ncbi:MAG TPA: hypothetical protein VGM76_09230 [Lacipirellulaceae bacterium]|jgi:hypothetical protein